MFEEFIATTDSGGPLMKDLCVDVALHKAGVSFDASKYHDDIQCLVKLVQIANDKDEFLAASHIGLMILVDRMDKELKELKGQCAVKQAADIIGGINVN